jgi:hypothetical protein
VYLIFNEGYGPMGPENAERLGLAAEVIRLARLLARLVPADGECHALLALLLLHHARRDARVAADGSLVPLDEQDRLRWYNDEVGRTGGPAAGSRVRGPGSLPGPGRDRGGARDVAGRRRDAVAAHRCALRGARSTVAVSGGPREPGERRFLERQRSRLSSG